MFFLFFCKYPDKIFSKFRVGMVAHNCLLQKEWWLFFSSPFSNSNAGDRCTLVSNCELCGTCWLVELILIFSKRGLYLSALCKNLSSNYIPFRALLWVDCPIKYTFGFQKRGDVGRAQRKHVKNITTILEYFYVLFVERYRYVWK